jgi:hypothetical protein
MVRTESNAMSPIPNGGGEPVLLQYVSNPSVVCFKSFSSIFNIVFSS